MNDLDSLENQDIQHLKLFLYLLPVFGFFPALWTLYRHKGTRQERSLSRLVIKLALGWLVAYFLLGAGATTSESLQIPLLLTSSLPTAVAFPA
jgi:phosphoglycerol transferase MdoB-like AlkP superfamily enzyme